MFYNRQKESARKRYKRLLNGALSIGNIVRPNSKTVHLPYELSEQVFCRSFGAENIAGKDVSIDAKQKSDGIGIKTFTGGPLQKIAEFNKVSKYPFSNDNDKAIKQVCKYRNYRIANDVKQYDVSNLTYHLIIRKNTNKIFICETGLDQIELSKIKKLNSRTNHILKFTDGIHNYSFNRTKSTLYMKFNKLNILEKYLFNFDNSDIDYLKDHLIDKPRNREVNEKVILPLFSERKKKVAEKSGLNQWRAEGRPRHNDEVYIPIPRRVHNESPNFFPMRDKVFRLTTDNKKVMLSKVCQSGDKALMSNPNRDLGHWILRDVLKVKPGQIVTNDTLIKNQIDSVVIKKIDENNYNIKSSFNYLME